jgi:hypothetical protein
MIYSKSVNFSAHTLTKEILEMFDCYNTLVFDTTWTDETDLIVIDEYLKEFIHNRVVLISTFDQQLHGHISDIRINHISTKNFCFWLIATDKFFLKYSKEDVTPIKFINNFICYQRKIYDEREILYELLKNKNGIITIGNRSSHEVNKNLPYHNGYFEINDDNGLSPNDIWSLGNLDIWNSSFLNIVTETTQNLKSPDCFLSEKTFKPIIGMRPFLINGNPKSNEYLRNMGFETFDEDFGYSPSNCYMNNSLQLLRIVDELKDVDLLYKKLLPKIEHNKNNLESAVKKEWEKIKILSNDYN